MFPSSRRRRFVLLASLGAIALLLGVFRLTRPSGGETPAAGPGPVSVAAPTLTLMDWADRIDRTDAEGFAGLFDAALALSDEALREQVLARIAAAWLKADARGLTRYFMRLEVDGDARRLDLLAKALMSGLTELDANLASSDDIKELIRRLVLHLARTDPATALAWADRWLLGDTKDAAYVQIARGLARADLPGAIVLAEGILSPLRRMQALAAVSGVWAQRDFVSSVAWASTLPGATERALALNATLLAAAAADPVQAGRELAVAERALAAEHRTILRAALAEMNLTEADLANDPETYREKLASGVVPPPTSSDVELLADAARVIATRWAERDADGAFVWADSLESEFLRLKAAQGGLAALSATAPRAAVDRFVGSYADQPSILAAIYETWTRTDPASAAGSTRDLDNATHRRVATETVVATWAPAAPLETARWVDTLPSTERSDGVLLLTVESLAASHPAESWGRALQVRDESLRARALRVAFSAYVTTSPEEARRTLMSSALSPAHKERLQELLENFGG